MRSNKRKIDVGPGQHVPAPWHTEPLQWDQGASIAICGPDDYGILAVIGPTNADDEPDIHTAEREVYDEANAALIIAAPMMRAALNAINARIVGAWHTPDLKPFGPFTTDTVADVKRIAMAALKSAQGE